MKNTIRYGWLLPVLLVMASCDKKGMIDMAPVDHPMAGDSNNLQEVMAAPAFTLFRQAMDRSKIFDSLKADNYYTVLAPDDAAMKAAGFDGARIGAMPVDSLRRVVSYHILEGMYNEDALNNAQYSREVYSLLRDEVYDNANLKKTIYPGIVYLKRKDVLYVNGDAINKPDDKALAAVNGYIYRLDRVLNIPEKTSYEMIASRPELSLYAAAIKIVDSLYLDYGWVNVNEDPYMHITQAKTYSKLFNRPRTIGQTPSMSPNQQARLTILAPTNAAFEKAGIHNRQELLDFALRSPVDRNTEYDGEWLGWLDRYFALDSALERHFMISSRFNYVNQLTYNDLQFGASLNDGRFNARNYSDYFPEMYYGQFLTMPLLQFSSEQGAVQVRWSNDPQVPKAPLPAGHDRHFTTRDGMIFEIDQLFY